MTEMGRDPYDSLLEHELRAAAPRARALFVDELARRVRVQRSRMRPSRARMGLALGFSALMIAALGVLGAPGLVAHAATAIVNTATSVVSGGGSTSTAGATSGTDQYAVKNGICHRLAGGGWQLIIVDASSLDAHAAHGDIIPAPPWGCPGDEHVSSTNVVRTTTVISGQTIAGIFKPVSLTVQVTSANGTKPSGSVSCFDDLNRIVNSVPLDPTTGTARCNMTFSKIGVHPITAVFKTGDVNKWASSAGNVVNVNVVKSAAFISFQSSQTPAPFGAGVTFTANVSSGGAQIPTGTVQFRDGTTALGSPVALSAGGVATFSTSTLAVGTHTIAASYGGDGNFDPADASLSQEIKPVADHLVVTVNSTTVAGTSLSATVTAQDSAGRVATTYAGTVHFTSSDAQAGLPADYTFAPGDNGTHTFSNVALRTAGAQTLVASDGNGLTGSANVSVSAAAAARLALSTSASTVAGAHFGATVSAFDAFGNAADGYRGTVSLGSSDAHATLPAAYAFKAGDGGRHAFTDIVFTTSGAQTLTAGDGTLGASAKLSVAAAAASKLVAAAPANATAGVAIPVTVTARDAFGNVATSYTGAVRFSSTDPQSTVGAGLPGDYTFAAADQGVHTFGVVLKTVGSRTVVVNDTVLPITAGSASVTVAAAPASMFVLSAPASTRGGNSITLSVTARDRFGNTADGYRGTVRFSSTDDTATLPGAYTFTSADRGAQTFGGVVLNTGGIMTVSVADIATPSVQGQATIAVSSRPSPPPPGTEPSAPAALQTPPTTTSPQPSATMTAEPTKAGTVSVAPASGAPTTVGWAPATFGSAPVTVSATVAPPAQTQGIQFAAGTGVIQINAVTGSGQPVTTLNDVLDIAIPGAPPDVAPMYQRGTAPWVVIPKLGGTTLPAGQPDGWYFDRTTLHILTRHLTKFGLAQALEVKWGTRRRVHLRWAQRIVVYGAPSVDAKATYTLRRGKTVYGRWTRTLPAGKGAPANLWLAGKHAKPGVYRLTIDIKAGPQRWTQAVVIRYL